MIWVHWLSNSIIIIIVIITIIITVALVIIISNMVIIITYRYHFAPTEWTPYHPPINTQADVSCHCSYYCHHFQAIIIKDHQFLIIIIIIVVVIVIVVTIASLLPPSSGSYLVVVVLLKCALLTWAWVLIVHVTNSLLFSFEHSFSSDSNNYNYIS